MSGESEPDWDALRAMLNDSGISAAEEAAATGLVSRAVAGARIAYFNDMLIEKLKARHADRK